MLPRWATAAALRLWGVLREAAEGPCWSAPGVVHANGPLVVLHHKDAGQLVQRRHVHALVELACRRHAHVRAHPEQQPRALKRASAHTDRRHAKSQ